MRVRRRAPGLRARRVRRPRARRGGQRSRAAGAVAGDVPLLRGRAAPRDARLCGGALCSRPLSTLEPGALAALRLGLLQLLFLDGIAEHAAVHESVELAKQSTRGGAGLVNAVLRRATRDGRALLEELSDETPAGAATLRSVPQWLAELWWRELGAEQARELLAHVNDPAESALRVNTLVASREAVVDELPVPSRTVTELPEALVLEAPFDVQGSELFARGAIMAQARASMLAGRALAPQPGARVLDLCAAPGAKATQLGSADRGPRRARRGRAPHRPGGGAGADAGPHAGQLRRVDVGDAGAFDGAGSYDAVLVDPPCSGLGTLQSRPDLRWRTNPERIAALSVLQARVLRAGANATAPGGALVYSVCTISRAEGIDVVEALVRERTDFELEDLGPMLPAAALGRFLQTLPSRDRTDGFFIARLRRKVADTGRVSL